MKFYVFMVMATIFVAGSANAQHVNLGIKAGLNVYNINNDNGTKYDSKVGLHAGLLGHIHLTKQWAVQPELVYSAQGAKYIVSNIETKINLGYINIPVLLQYMFENGFRLQAGPQVGFLISGKAKTGNNETDIKDNINTVDFALGIGAGYIHTKSGFGVDARYNIGLSNINDNSSVKSTNRGFQLGVFYQFKHKS